MNLPGEYLFSSHINDSYKSINQLQKVKGITVNTVHGNEASIEKVKRLYNPAVESMEGAAFFSSCKEIGVEFIQIRAISNYVEKRDKSKWEMALAIKNLNNFIIDFLKD